MDWVDRSEGRGNARETADCFFHPSRPSGLGHLIQRKGLIQWWELACGAGRMSFHPGNPGLKVRESGECQLNRRKFRQFITKFFLWLEGVTSNDAHHAQRTHASAWLDNLCASSLGGDSTARSRSGHSVWP